MRTVVRIHAPDSISDWTRRSRLKQADDGLQVSTYTYDAFDSRAKRVETAQGASTTTYYDELLEVEVTASGEIETFFVPGEEGRIAALKREAGEAQLEDPVSAHEQPGLGVSRDRRERPGRRTAGFRSLRSTAARDLGERRSDVRG